MLKIDKLDLAHQTLLKERFRSLNLNLSEYSFANLYLFRKLHEYEIIFNKEIFIRGRTREGRGFLMPTSHPKEWSEESFQFLKQQSDCLFPIPFEWLIYFERDLKNFSFYESDSDYLFKTAKIAHYPGRKLSTKRNLVHQLFEKHRVEFYDFKKEFEKEAIQIIEMWQKESHQDKNQVDYYSAIEAIQLFDELSLKGRWYQVDGIPKGIVIGEELNSSCFALHFGKATKEVHGLNQFMFQDFAQQLEEKYPFLNFEQDLGLPNLRQTKHSYQPDQLLQKYCIYFA